MPPEITAPRTDADTSTEATLERLAGGVRRLARQRATGDLAALRRLDPDHPEAGAFYRVLAGATRGPGPELDTLPRWALATWAFAQNPEKLGGNSLGRSLGDAEISESRVNRLLAARGCAFRYQMRSVVRILIDKSAWLPVHDVGLLVLAEGRDEKTADELRMKIARDYWRTRPSEATGPDIHITGGDDT
jgi:CRISPR system Cascade subunit CasB